MLKCQRRVATVIVRPWISTYITDETRNEVAYVKLQVQMIVFPKCGIFRSSSHSNTFDGKGLVCTKVSLKLRGPHYSGTLQGNTASFTKSIPRLLKCDGNLILLSSKNYEPMSTNSCTWHDSCAVVVCTKYSRDIIKKNAFTLKRNFQWIWIMMDMR